MAGRTRVFETAGLRAGSSTSVRSALLAGASLCAAGALILLGITTAEGLYDDVYTTHVNEISDLGATVPPNSVIHQPSAAIFNSTMVASGAALICAALALRTAGASRKTHIAVLLLGVGVLGVGLFPGNRAPIHGIFALVAFTAGGFAAIFSALDARGPFRWFAMFLGVTSLLALMVGLFGAQTRIYEELGDGAIERWIAYPVVLWTVVFGGRLMGADAGYPPQLGPRA